MMIFYMVAGIFVIITLKGFYRLRVYQEYDIMYRLAHMFTNYFWFFAAAYIIGGFVGILYRVFREPYQQIEEIAGAVEKIYDTGDAPIELSAELKGIALNFTELRMKVRQNERAAKEAEQRKNDLIVYLAHDLKTPLTSVIGYLTLLKEEQEISSQLQKKYIDISLEKAERLEELINEFFEITRFNLTTLTLEIRHINFTRLLEQLTYEFHPMLGEKNLKIQLSCPQDLMFACDVDKMQRVLDNLLRNAVNYSYPDTTITIEVTIEEDRLHMVFHNCGQTIIPEKLERIFEQFYRLDTSRSTKSGGAGLGLAISKEIIELHGGTIRAESENENITFQIELPYRI
ncbi:MAG: HAMP domain-containing histidine kinase [Lachnospiraceae bacterium]|nr:HAMP domain-containing histidine kinase [Lachnospiraceae bacterium]